MVGTGPARPQKLDAYVAAVVRERILSGELKPGTHLVEADLATEIGVSAGTVRAGFRSLRAEGLILYEPNRGVFVATMTAQDALEVYSLRNYLEALASRLAAERIDDRGRRRMRRAMSNLADAAGQGTRSEVIGADMALHDEIIELSGHSRLKEMYAGIRNQSILFMNLTEHFHPQRAEIVTIHESLAEAIAGGDGEQAEKLAIVHNTADGETLRRLLETGSGTDA